MKYPSLKYGQRSKAVRAAQNGVARFLDEKGIKRENKRNGAYGSLTRRDFARFKRAVGLPAVGKVFGSDAWKALQPWLGEYDRRLIRQHNRAVNLAKARRKAAIIAATKGVGARTRVAGVALEFYAKRGNYRYRQIRPMLPPSIFNPVQYDRLDCSSSNTKQYQEAGLPDPNGRGYDGQGYTGTMWVRGSLTRSPQAGDLAFYGDQGGGVPSHMAIHVTPTMVVSFGSDPVRHVNVRYRTDYRGSRSYL